MEPIYSNIFSKGSNNKNGRLPRQLECPDTECSKCIETLPKTGRRCPACEPPLLKTLKLYPIISDYLELSSMMAKDGLPNVQQLSSLAAKNTGLIASEEVPNVQQLSSLAAKRNVLIASEEGPNAQQLSSLAAKNNVLIASEEVLKSSIDKRIDLKKDTNEILKGILAFRSDNINQYKVELLNSKIAKHVAALNDVLIYEIVPNAGNFLSLGGADGMSCSDIIHTSTLERVFACVIDVDIGYKYGKIEVVHNMFHVHSMTSNFKPPVGTPLVLLCDLKNRVKSMNRIKPFIRVGDQTLYFTLTNESSFATYRLLKLFMGEAGCVLRGCEALVACFLPKLGFKTGYDLHNSVTIQVPKPNTKTGYDYIFSQTKTRVSSGTVVLQSFIDQIAIIRVPEQGPHIPERGPHIVLNVVGELSEGCNFDFMEMDGKFVKACGLVFDFLSI